MKLKRASMPMRAVFVTILIASMAIRPASATASMANARFAAHYKPKFLATKTIPFLCDDPAATTRMGLLGAVRCM